MLIQHLSYLAALAREQHFGRAADACHVSQPTLSAGIARLERELGLPLVRRGHRYQGLTAEGERVLRWALRILADRDGLNTDLAAMRDGLVGRLRLGAIPTSLPVITLITKPLREHHPALDISIVSSSSRGIEQALHESQIDIGVTYLENEPLRDVRSLTLYQERYLLLVPDDGRYARLQTASWAQAAGEPLCLLTPDMQNRRIIDAIFRQVGVAPRPVLETNSISALYAHVRDGMACAVMSHAWLHLFDVPAGMRVLPLGEPDVQHAVGLVWLDRDPEALLIQATVALVDTMRARAATLES